MNCISEVTPLLSSVNTTVKSPLVSESPFELIPEPSIFDTANPNESLPLLGKTLNRSIFDVTLQVKVISLPGQEELLHVNEGIPKKLRKRT